MPTKNSLKPEDLEKTLDQATELFRPYRGWIAVIEIIKNTFIACTCLIMFITAITVGITHENPLAGALIAIFWIFFIIAGVYFLKYLYSARLRQSNFLLAVFCRAENNRHYLKLGLELRPGFLGKWIEVS